MNKIVNINLGGYPFNIDEDAYEHLTIYLNTIHRHFEPSEGYDEITTDIEIRLAEIFQDHLGERSIVTRADVKTAISVMGTPEEFGAEPIEPPKFKSKKTTIKTGKRLFRNTEDKALGGVCAGLAAYFGIKDALWVRIILVILVLSSVGILIPAYIIAWAIIPEAKTSADRLAMKGEPINVSNIGKMVEEEMKDLSERISEIGDNINDEFKSQKKRIDGSGFSIRNVLSRAIYIFGSVIRAILEMIMKLWKPLLMIVSLIFAIVSIALWIAGAVGIFTSLPFTDYLMPNQNWVAYLGLTNVFVIIAIPMLSLLMLLLRGWTKYRLNNYWRAGLGAFFVLNVISFFSVGSLLAREFNTATITDKSYELGRIDTLYLSSLELGDLDKNLIRFFDNDIILDGDRLIVDHISVDLLKSDDNRFHITESVFSRGRSNKEANALASNITFNTNVTEKEITIPSHIAIQKGTKYRRQKVKYKIEIPEGKHISFDHIIGQKIHRFDRSSEERSHWHHQSGVWKMQEDGLTNMTNKEEEGKEEHHYYGVKKFQIEGEMEVEFYQSYNYKIDLEAKGAYRDAVTFKEFNKELFITSTIENPDSPIRLSIGVPELQSLYALGTDDIKIEGFDQEEMSIDFNSQYELKLLSNVENLIIDQKGSGKMELIGKGLYLNAKVGGNSDFDTERFSLSSADVRVLNESWMRLTVSDTLRQEVDESSKIVLEQEPKVLIQKTL